MYRAKFVRFSILLSGLLGFTENVTAQAKKPVKVTPEQIAAAEETLTKFGCTLHRDEKAPGNPVDLVLFPRKTTDSDVKRFLPTLRRLSTIESLDFGGSKIGNAGLKDIAANLDLHSLYLDCTPVTDAGVKELASLQRLRWLDLSHTSVTSVGLKELAGLQNMQSLFLSGCQRINDKAIENLNEFKRLQRLSLDHTKITTAGFQMLTNLDKVQVLHLPSNITLKLLEPCKELTELTADNGSGAKDNVLPELPRLTSLTLLGDCHTEIVKSVCKIRSLKEFRLQSMLVSPAICKELGNLQNLETLCIYSVRKASEAELKHFAQLKTLKCLGLFDSRITEAGIVRFQLLMPNCEVYFKPSSSAGSGVRVPTGSNGGSSK
ncbi:MAG: hypothetical protein K8T89_05165 [Planctomycetes bacterium]|nr:hypothetical protein [Planctomycetota bacterium]